MGQEVHPDAARARRATAHTASLPALLPGIVEVEYVGRLGNHLAQYCLGRIIASTLGFRFYAPAIAGFPHACACPNPLWRLLPARPGERLTGRHRFDLAAVLANRRRRRLFLSGPFLRYEYYRPHKPQIRRWLASATAASAWFGDDDLTIHIRTGDLWQSNRAGPIHPEYHALPFSFYAHVIKQRAWRRVVVVAEDTSDAMVQALHRRFGAEVLSGGATEDFERLRRSRNIVLSVSSFAWWAAWLSDAQRIFYPLVGLFDPQRARQRPAAWQQNLWVNDEPRYSALKPRTPLIERDWTGTEADRQLLLES
jgi:hypothetical protein